MMKAEAAEAIKRVLTAAEKKVDEGKTEEADTLCRIADRWSLLLNQEGE